MILWFFLLEICKDLAGRRWDLVFDLFLSPFFFGFGSVWFVFAFSTDR